MASMEADGGGRAGSCQCRCGAYMMYNLREREGGIAYK
jgi:hypothetical protein